MASQLHSPRLQRLSTQCCLVMCCDILISTAYDKADLADSWCCLAAQIDPQSSLAYYAKAVLILTAVAASYFGTFFAFHSFAVRRGKPCRPCLSSSVIYMCMSTQEHACLHALFRRPGFRDISATYAGLIDWCAMLRCSTHTAPPSATAWTPCPVACPLSPCLP